MTTQLPDIRQGGGDTVEGQLSSFGSRLRELRLRRGWTLQELAANSGLSKPFLSRLESGDRQASIAAVLTLSRVFNVSLGSLFESTAAAEPCVIVRAGAAAERNTNGLKYAPLSDAGRFLNLQPLRVKVSPARRGNEHYSHDGEEWIYVLSGILTLSLAERTYDLFPGDAAHFESRQPHRLIARGPDEAEVLVVASPSASPPLNRRNWGEHRALAGINLLPMPKTEPQTFSRRRDGWKPANWHNQNQQPRRRYEQTAS